MLTAEAVSGDRSIHHIHHRGRRHARVKRLAISIIDHRKIYLDPGKIFRYLSYQVIFLRTAVDVEHKSDSESEMPTGSRHLGVVKILIPQPRVE